MSRRALLVGALGLAGGSGGAGTQGAAGAGPAGPAAAATRLPFGPRAYGGRRSGDAARFATLMIGLSVEVRASPFGHVEPDFRS